MSTPIQIIGNITREPEVKTIPSGKTLTKFSVAVSTRKKVGDEWQDGDPSFYDCTAWDDLGSHVADSLRKGDRVIVCGRIAQRFWETPAGEKRSSFEVTVDEVGPSLKWVTTNSTRAERGGGSFNPIDPFNLDKDAF